MVFLSPYPRFSSLPVACAIALSACSSDAADRPGSPQVPPGATDGPALLESSIARGPGCDEVGKSLPESEKVGPDKEVPTLQGIVFNKDVYRPGDTLEILFRGEDNRSGLSHISLYGGWTGSSFKGPTGIADQEGEDPLREMFLGVSKLMPDGALCDSVGIVSQYVLPGRYYLRFFWLHDDAGNSVRY